MYSDCQAVREEFEVGSTCRDVYRNCDGGNLPCNVTALCSNECRDLYERMQRCNSSDPTLIELRDKVNLMCGVSTEHNTSCVTLFPMPDFSYRYRCGAELVIPDFQCGELCRDRLVLYSSDCCIVNQAIIVRLGRENETLHTDVVWSICNVTSPGRCPNPPPPVRITATPTAPSTATATPTQTVGNPSEGGASSTEIDSVVFLLSTFSAILYLNFFTL